MGNKGYAEFWRVKKVYSEGCGTDRERITLFLAHLYQYLPTCNLPHGGLVRPRKG